MSRRLIVCTIELDEDALHTKLSSLPDKLQAAISGIVNGGLTIDSVYLMDLKKKKTVAKDLEASALNFHNYAVEVRLEKCALTGCTKHLDSGKVVRLHDRFPNHTKPRKDTSLIH